MNTNNQLTINRKPEVIKRLGISKSTFHTRINQQLLPPSISLGSRAKGYVQQEYDAVIAAMVAGKTESEIKKLVSDLVAQRKLAA